MLLADIEAVFDYLVIEKEIPQKNIILYGRSLGCGPSIHLASKFEVGGLIVQSGFTSTYRVVLDLKWDLPGDQFLNLNKIKNVQCLIFFIHGTNDEIVPFEHSISLWKQSKNKVAPLWLKGIGHNDMEIAYRIIFRRMKEFLQIIKREQRKSEKIKF
jgi:abhydrolase domain-containing protein 17